MGVCRACFAEQRREWYQRKLLPLGSGEYPPECKDTGYTDIDPRIRVRARPRTPKREIMDIRGQLQERLERTGMAGATLVYEIQVLNVYQFWRLAEPARTAVIYMSGAKRKRQTFAQWQAERRRNARNGETP